MTNKKLDREFRTLNIYMRKTFVFFVILYNVTCYTTFISGELKFYHIAILIILDFSLFLICKYDPSNNKALKKEEKELIDTPRICRSLSLTHNRDVKILKKIEEDTNAGLINWEESRYDYDEGWVEYDGKDRKGNLYIIVKDHLFGIDASHLAPSCNQQGFKIHNINCNKELEPFLNTLISAIQSSDNTVKREPLYDWLGE